MPYYDAAKIGYIYMPESAINPESQQGQVIQAAPNAPFEVGSYVFFHPYEGEQFRWNQQDLIALRFKSIVASRDCDNQLIPRDEDVIIKPHWPDWWGRTKAGLIILDRVYDNPRPEQGTVIRCGKKVQTLRAGERVLIPTRGGAEIGWIDTLYYLIPEDDVLAVVSN